MLKHSPATSQRCCAQRRGFETAFPNTSAQDAEALTKRLFTEVADLKRARDWPPQEALQGGVIALHHLLRRIANCSPQQDELAQTHAAIRPGEPTRWWTFQPLGRWRVSTETGYLALVLGRYDLS